MADPDYHKAKMAGYQWGVKEERERIIALLTAQVCRLHHGNNCPHPNHGDDSKCWQRVQCSDFPCYAALEHIALINGDNNAS